MIAENQPVTCILGASGGIGSTLTRQLASQGHKLLLASRSLEKLKPFAAEYQAVVAELDATKFDQVEQFVSENAKEFGRLDGMVNCVGSVFLKPAHLTSYEEYQETMAKNLDSAFSALRAATKAMSNQGGSIVLLSSCAGRVGLPSHEVIAAAKAGIIGLVQAAASSYANKGIRVNAVAPGLVCTPATEKLRSNDASRKASMDMHPLGRLGEPEDIASAITWLLDSKNSWVTGQTLGVDGGLATVRPRGGK